MSPVVGKVIKIGVTVLSIGVSLVASYISDKEHDKKIAEAVANKFAEFQKEKEN